MQTAGCNGANSIANSIRPKLDAARLYFRSCNERQPVTHKFSIGGHQGYLTVGLYEDGTVAVSEAGAAKILRPTETEPQQTLPFCANGGGFATVLGVRRVDDAEWELL